MRALRASGGYVGRTLRTRFPSLMCEMRTGATLAGGGATGTTGCESLVNKPRTPFGSPISSPVVDDPTPVICGGPSSPVVGMPFGIRVGILRVRSKALLRGAVFELMCALAAGGSPRGRPRLTGVESDRSNGNPAGRSSGKISNTPTANACKPNEVRAVSPRRERSFHDELRVSSNMVSSLVKATTTKDTNPPLRRQPRSKEKGRICTRPLGTFLTHAVSRLTYLG